ncbi:MAG: inositol monophosphatase [Anaerolineales bacterium]|jgi:myo-inositol-1(or 4)-monophosphatase|nr:inositol monophosphatase [Chloroflexota bacterium]MBK6644374.1 inositol monophosphatase [Anaerolineales bacterium]MCC6985873.1 inositol monophosphatase [Anaerolineales bacterium]
MKPTLSDLERLARQAGSILRDGYNKEHTIHYKGTIDLVTEADHASEAFLLGEIKSAFPGGHILAEESGNIQGSNEDLWYIDPLDGTVNYAHHIPIFCVSIGFASNERLTLGVVYDPMRDELFSAEKGKGAFLNGKRINVSNTTELQKSLLVTGFPYDTWDTDLDNFKYFERLAKKTQGVRRLGSAALDACYVGAGRFDGFWEFKLKAWDVAAGGLIASEAGAKVTAIDGRDDFLAPPMSILATTPGIYDAVKEQLK